MNQEVRHKLYDSIITGLVNSDGDPLAGVFRLGILLITIISALGCLLMTFLAGLGNDSIFQLVFFSAWILSPFACFIFLNIRYRRWPLLLRMILYCISLAVSVTSVFTYGGLLTPPDTNPTTIFILAPLFSWLLIAVFLLIVRVQLRKRRREF